jgi:hypothetical protein
MEVKKCNICNVTRDMSFFKSNWYSKKWTKTYKPFCKICKRVIDSNKLKDKIIVVRWKPVAVESEEKKKKRERQNRYREKYKEEIKIKAQEYFKKIYADPERRKRILRRNRKSYQKNKFKTKQSIC